MKKIAAIALALCLLLSLSGCVSQSDVDAATARRDALQAELNTLQAQYDALQTRLEPHSAYIQPLMEEDYDTVLDLLEQQQTDKEKAAAEMLEPYLVTVELTLENFHDYFEWNAKPVIDELNGGEEGTELFLTSTAYEQGLVLYESDAVFGIECFYVTDYEVYTRTSTDVVYFKNNLHLERSFELGRLAQVRIYAVSGTVTFLKADAVTDYDMTACDSDSAYGEATLHLVNGESLVRKLHYGSQF